MKRRTGAIYFIRRQIRGIRSGELPVFVLLILPVALIVLMAVRLLRPLAVIRFGCLGSNRIGHFASETELYLCERDKGMHRRRTFDIFYYSYPISNRQLKKMWERTRTLRIWGFAKWLDWFNHQLPGCMRHAVPIPSQTDPHGLLARTEPHLAFTPEEEERGGKALRELGIPEGSPFVCFNARDSAYLDAALPARNWRYHDYRDSNVYNYLPAAEKLAGRGYYMVRMGAVVKKALANTNPRIIDYAINNRTEFLDIYLGAKCRFFICDTSGIYAIPAIFRRPIVWVNYIPLDYVHVWGKNHLFTLKKLWSRKKQRFLTFPEILGSEIRGFLKSEQYEQAGIEIIENTPEEITALAVEMDERLKGSWQAAEEDEELQRRFWALFKPDEPHGDFLSRIGTEFLRQNRELLE